MKKYICNFITRVYISFIVWLIMIGSNVFAQAWFFNQVSKYNPNVPNAEKGIGSSDTATLENNILPKVKNTINQALALLAFVAIVILLIAWFKMLFFAQDDWEQKKAFATVKNVAIALIFIGISWLIVSGIFWFVDIVTK